MNYVSIKGMDKAAVLVALHSASRQMWQGFLENPLSYAEAVGHLKLTHKFDYLQGRVLKVDLTGDEFWCDLYDRDNGAGAAARAVARIVEGK